MSAAVQAPTKIGLNYRLDQETDKRISELAREIIYLASERDRSSAEQLLLDHLYRIEQEKALAEGILSGLAAGITVHDREFRILYQNSRIKAYFGSSLGEKCYRAYNERESACPDCPVAACFGDGETHVEVRPISTNGATTFLENVASPLRDGSGEIVAAVELVRDITERKVTQEKVSRLSNLYQALSNTNKAILHLKKREALFHEICRIAVTYGRFCLVWIGIPEPETGLLRPVASCGSAQRYLDSLRVSIDETVAEGQGPTGRAIRARTPYICNDFLADTHTAPWHDVAQSYGIAASAAFPLEQEGGLIGALKVYSQETGFFDQDMVTLLQEMADSISFALDNFAREEKRVQTEIALQESEERLKLVLEGSRDGFWDWDVATGTMKVSDRYAEMLGFRPGDMEPTVEAVRRLVHPDDRKRVHKILEKHLAGVTQAYVVEFRMAAKTGGVVWLMERGKVVSRDENGVPLRVAGTCSDITERKYFEENLRFLSTHDSMTGLFNRAYFDAELERMAPSRHFPVSIVIADVDGLKHVNDGFGHAEGDRLIRQAARALRDAFRAEDVIARIGGDEFAVLLPNTDVDAVKEAVKRVREFQAKINAEENGDYTLSLSIGSATASNGAELLATLKLADSRMYYYKFQRKNRQ